MKRVLSKFSVIVPISILALAIFLIPQVGKAVDLITVSFEKSPLFDEANFLPGDAVTRGFTVTNVFSGNLKVSLKLDPYKDDDDLGSQIQVIIKEHGSASNIFSGTLDGLATSGSLTLKSALASGASVTYDFSATFNPAAGNNYQSTDENPVSLFFDIVIGAESEDGLIQTFGSTSSGSGVSSCGNNIVNLGEQCDLGSANGLCPSACSISCTINQCGATAGTSTFAGLPMPPAGLVGGEQITLPFAGGQIAGGVAFGPTGGKPGEVLGEAVTPTTTAPEAAAKGAGQCSPHYWWWLIGYLVYALLLLLVYWLERKEKPWWAYIIGILLTVAAILWWWFEPCPKHLWAWPAAIVVYFAVLTGWYSRYNRKNGQGQLPLDNPNPPA